MAHRAKDKGRKPIIAELSRDADNIFGAGSLNRMVNEDTLVEKKGIKVYREMEQRDAQVRYSFALKKFALLSVDWSIEAANTEDLEDAEKEEAERQAKFINHVMENIEGDFDSSLLKILNAWRDGFSVTEKLFNIIPDGEFAGMFGLERLKTRDPDSFNFSTDKHGNLETMTQDRTFSDDGITPLPIDKFIIYSHNPNGDEGVDVYGQSDFRPAYRYYFMNDHVHRFWGLYAQKYAMPMLWGKLPRNVRNTEYADKLLTILKNMQADSVGVGADDIDISVIESGGKSTSDFKELLTYNNTMIQRAILVGGDLVGGSGDGKGSYALSRTHWDVFVMALTHEQKVLEETILGEQLIYQLIDLNFSKPYYPRFRFDALIKDDQKLQSEIAVMLAGAGLINRDEEWVREFVGVPELAEGKALDQVEPEQEPAEVEAPKPEAPDVAQPAPEPATQPEANQEKDVKVSEDLVLNGAQIAAAVQIVIAVAAGKLPRDSGLGQLELMFNISADQASKLMGSAGTNTPTTPNPIPKAPEASPAPEVPGFQVRRFQLSREKTAAEAKIDFAAIEEALDRDEAVAIEELTEVMDKIGASYIKDAEKAKIIGSQDSKKIDKLRLKGLGELRDAMAKHLEIVFRKGNQDAKKELGKENFIGETLAGSKLRELLAQKAFGFAGIVQDDMLKKLNAILANGIEKGWSAERIAREIEKVIGGFTGKAGLLKPDGKAVTPSAIMRSVRTNTTSAYNLGRREFYQDPAQGDTIKGVQFSAIIDSRTSDICRHLDGKVFNSDDTDAINRFTPPLHFNCRSVLVPITEQDVDRDGSPEIIGGKDKNTAEELVPPGF